MTERIILASPREPCGATWLINCLLLLGIKTYRTGPEGQAMWLEGANGWILDRRENLLRQWLPALSQQQHFIFCDQVEVQWLHEWPTEADWSSRVLYFIRDPRDAFYSRYCREGASLPFSEYLAFPDAFSLLDKIDHWRAFNESWLDHPNLKILKFEDYKADAFQLLRQTIDWIGISVSEEALCYAVNNSSFEKAAEAERDYLKTFGSDQIINRSGKPGEWRSLNHQAHAISDVTERCSSMLRYFGYPVTDLAENGVGPRSQFTQLKHFDSIRLHSSMRRYIVPPNADLQSLITRLNPELIKASGLTDSESHVMLDRLSEYAHGAKWGTSLKQLKGLYTDLGIERLGWWGMKRLRCRSLVRRLCQLLTPKRKLS